ncbi:MAG: GNAT family N-acetyltransferase [Firmicutes bacterium]|nr:GNAT family N-acetyltransferase [Bacillota bacterium]
MICLRHFIAEDIPALRKAYPDMTEKELLDMLQEWHEMKYNGRYFEMFAVLSGNEIVGEISLYEHSKSAVSIGPTIYEPYRQKGYGKEAVKLAICRAREKGFRIIIQQVRTDNTASIALHNSLGFEIDRHGYIYKNRKDQPCYLFLMAI